MDTNDPLDGRVDSFRAVSREFDALYARFAKSCDLSEAEYWSLMMIRGGARSQAEISDQTFISRQTINSAFKLLVKKGLVKLEPLERDQRTKEITLTETGEAFAARYIDRVLEVENLAWQTMDPQEQMMLVQLTRKYCDLIRKTMEQTFTTESSSSEDLSSQ